jgi:hypothetical protein
MDETSTRVDDEGQGSLLSTDPSVFPHETTADGFLISTSSNHPFTAISTDENKRAWNDDEI